MVGLLEQRAARITAEAERFGREAERRFRAFFDTSVAGAMHTLRDRRVVECNRTLVELLGCDSRQELMTMEADRLFEDPTDYAELRAAADRGSAPAERRRLVGRGTRLRHGAADRPAPRRLDLVRGQPRRRGVLFRPGRGPGAPRSIRMMR